LSGNDGRRPYCAQGVGWAPLRIVAKSFSF
jgi:hypothetical protein